MSLRTVLDRYTYMCTHTYPYPNTKDSFKTDIYIYISLRTVFVVYTYTNLRTVFVAISNLCTY